MTLNHLKENSLEQKHGILKLMFLSENVRKYERQLNLLLLYQFKIVSASTEKLKTVLAATLKKIFSVNNLVFHAV